MSYFWFIFGVIWIFAFIWIAYEIKTAPLMPDDFDVEITDKELDDWLRNKESR